MKILNLYAGIGGNRKLWGDEHEIVAIELDPQIARIYKDHFPNDSVVVADAHEFLVDNYDKFDFIWASPPCPTHSRIRRYLGVGKGQVKPVYPDMKLYEEIIFLQSYFAGKWVVENVISYYEPLVKPQIISGHYFWSNFDIPKLPRVSRKHEASIADLAERKGFDLSGYKGIDKKKILRNCVEPDTGLHIMNQIRETDETS